MDELIQQNELLMKENDFLQSFAERFADKMDLIPEEAQGGQLSCQQKLAIALYEAHCLEREKEELTRQFSQTTIREKALVVAAEQRLATLRRLMFTFQREVLGDQQVSNNFQQNEEGVEQIVMRMPKQVFASSLQQFYDKQCNILEVNIEQYAKNANTFADQAKQLEKQSLQKQRAQGLSQIDFEQLKIENDKLQDKVATRNQEMLRIKLSAGNCMRTLNKFKDELHHKVEQKKEYDEQVKKKEIRVKEITEKIELTKKELEVDNKQLQVLRQKEIFAHDGPQSVDYLSLKVTQVTLERAVKDIERKISIKVREIENMRVK